MRRFEGTNNLTAIHGDDCYEMLQLLADHAVGDPVVVSVEPAPDYAARVEAMRTVVEAAERDCVRAEQDPENDIAGQLNRANAVKTRAAIELLRKELP